MPRCVAITCPDVAESHIGTRGIRGPICQLRSSRVANEKGHGTCRPGGCINVALTRIRRPPDSTAGAMGGPDCRCASAQPGVDFRTWRRAFALKLPRRLRPLLGFATRRRGSRGQARTRIASRSTRCRPTSRSRIRGRASRGETYGWRNAVVGQGATWQAHGWMHICPLYRTIDRSIGDRIPSVRFSTRAPRPRQASVHVTLAASSG